jgi:hypothetical protein
VRLVSDGNIRNNYHHAIPYGDVSTDALDGDGNIGRLGECYNLLMRFSPRLMFGRPCLVRCDQEKSEN